MVDYLRRLECDESGDGVQDEFLDAQLFQVTVEVVADKSVDIEDNWMMDMHQFLSTGQPSEELSQDERKRLAVQSRHSCLLQDTLYHKGADGVWRRAVQSDEKEAVQCEVHFGVAGGHYVGDATAQKIWQSGLWWSTTLKDLVRYCKECDLC